MKINPHHFWAKRGAVNIALLPLSLVFGIIIAIRRAIWRLIGDARADVPVIVVGNISIGGSGKTPTVIALAEALQRRGKRVGILSRGYRREKTGAQPYIALPDRPFDAAMLGDEPTLLMQRCRCPIAVGADRREAMRRLVHTQAFDVFLCDDGLQHYRLPRAFEIATFKSPIHRNLGNGWLLPAGPLREPISRLAQCDAAVLVVPPGFEGKEEIPPPARERYILPLHASHFYSINDTTEQIEATEAKAVFRDRHVCAMAAIAHPDSFFETLTQLGITLDEKIALADHRAEQMRKVIAEHPAEVILMSEKDAVKCRSFADKRCYALMIAGQIPDELMARIEKTLADRG